MVAGRTPCLWNKQSRRDCLFGPLYAGRIRFDLSFSPHATWGARLPSTFFHGEQWCPSPLVETTLGVHPVNMYSPPIYKGNPEKFSQQVNTLIHQALYLYFPSFSKGLRLWKVYLKLQVPDTKPSYNQKHGGITPHGHGLAMMDLVPVASAGRAFYLRAP